MTEEQFKTKVNELFNDLKDNHLEKKINIALKSGVLDLESYEDNYLLPKIFMTAFLSLMSNQYEPLQNHLQKEVKNLSLFL